MEPIPLISVPYFLSGLIYGMTTEDHLLEIEACYTGAEILFPEIDFIMNRIHQGDKNNDLQAALELGIVVLQLPSALGGCKNMQEDI